MREYEIDRNAPVFAEAVTDVAASAEAVWTALTDIARWPEFTPGITAARLEGPLAAGSAIHWSVNGLDLSSPLVKVVPQRQLVWRGHETAVHSWTIIPMEDGCRLLNAESIGKPFSGRTAEESTALVSGFLTRWNAALSDRARGVI